MPPEKIFKTVYQYNKVPIPCGDMAKLQEIANDCRTVRNYVYGRYGGIGGLSKIYPGYAVQNEMTRSGLREQLGLPSVYFYLSVFDALEDIKSQWTHIKNRVEQNLQANPTLTTEDRHYLRFVMKQRNCFEAILAGGGMELAGDWGKSYEALCAKVNAHRLNQYLRRQVRRHLKKPHTDAADGFPVSAKAYRYGDHGIYIAMKEKRKRLFILLTDNNHYDRQIYVRLYPEDGNIAIHVPIEVKRKNPAGYGGEIGIAVGMRRMFVTDRGSAYGEQYEEYQSALTDYVRKKLPGHRRNAENNPGTKKYSAGKARLEAALHTYVNAEINRMLDTEKPGTVYFPKLPGTSKAGVNKTVNAAVSMWQKGYVKSRLNQKCKERSVEFVEVFGKGIGIACSNCGAAGRRDGEIFRCEACGAEMPERQNTARNVLKKGQELKTRERLPGNKKAGKRTQESN